MPRYVHATRKREKFDPSKVRVTYSGPDMSDPENKRFEAGVKDEIGKFLERKYGTRRHGSEKVIDLIQRIRSKKRPTQPMTQPVVVYRRAGRRTK